MKKPDYDWWIQHSHTDSAFLLLADSPELFEQSILSRLKKVKRKPDQGVINQATYRAIHEQDRFGSMSSILDEIHPVITKPLEDPLHPFSGEIRADGDMFSDNESPFPALGVSAFWCPWAVRHNRTQLDKMAEWASACGMNYVRWFGSHDWQGGTDVQTPNYFQLMEETIQALAEHGLRSEITLFTRRHLISDPEWFVGEWAKLINSYRDHVLFVEIANEFNHQHNGWGAQEIRSLGITFKELSDAPLALSAPCASDWDGIVESLSHLHDGSPSDVTSVHFPRRDNTNEGPWRWVRQPWHSRWEIPNCPRLIIDNEHQRWDRSNGGRIIEVAASAPLAAFISGCGASAHHDICGVHNDKGEYSDLPEAESLRRVFRSVMPLIPSDICKWQETRVGTGGGPHPFPDLESEHWTHGGPSHGVSRAFAAVQHDKFAMLLSGVRDYVELSDVQSREFQIISLKNGEQVYEGKGPVRLDENLGQAFFVVTV
mgnify:CR=1 FL=1